MTEGTDTRAASELEGSAAAALLAVGVGAFVLGLLTTLNEASSGVADFLRFSEAVGPLSGKTIFAAAAYVAVLAAAAIAWRGRRIRLGPVLLAALVLLALGLLGTFPPFFEAFAE